MTFFSSNKTMPIFMLCFSNRAHPRLNERPQTPTLIWKKNISKNIEKWPKKTIFIFFIFRNFFLFFEIFSDAPCLKDQEYIPLGTTYSTCNMQLRTT